MQRDLSPQRRKELLNGFSPASARAAGLANDLRSVTPVAPDLPIEQLHMPVLLVGVTDDPYRSAQVVRYSAGRIPGVRAVVLERGGHVLVGQDAGFSRRYVPCSAPRRCATPDARPGFAGTGEEPRRWPSASAIRTVQQVT